MKKISGFTLIELIVVIVILGILAATALPKFMGIQQGARSSILSGARGAVSAAMNIAAATQASVANGVSNASITLDGVGISMVGGYPVATGTASGIYGAAGLSTDYTSTGGGTGLNSALTIQVLAAPTPANCSFVYSSATATLPARLGTVTTSGC